MFGSESLGNLANRSFAGVDSELSGLPAEFSLSADVLHTSNLLVDTSCGLANALRIQLGNLELDIEVENIRICSLNCNYGLEKWSLKGK